MKLEIYDCTLREGEQATGVSFNYEDRLKLCSILDDLGVDYIELGWPVVSWDIFSSFEPAIKSVKNAKIVAFGSTARSSDYKNDRNLNSIVDCGTRYACIFGKADISHVENQLRISGQENLERIVNSIVFLKEKGLEVFFDAEHFYDGYKRDADYAKKVVLAAKEAGASRVILCDTNGGLLPVDSERITKEIKKIVGENYSLGVHFHDDCDLAMANALRVLPFVQQIQGTINGIGERVGNLNLTTFISNYVDKINGKLTIDLGKLTQVNSLANSICGLVSNAKEPYVGRNSFTHKGGVHINAIGRGANYEHTNPERFGNKRVILLNSNGGLSCIEHVANELGFKFDKKLHTREVQDLLSELQLLERNGYNIGANSAEQYLLIDKYFGSKKELFSVNKWQCFSSFDNGVEVSDFNFLINVNGEEFSVSKNVDGGPVQAGFEALREGLAFYYPNVRDVHLHDFQVNIAREKEQKSTVRTEIWFRNREEYSCVGVHDNILHSSVIALSKGFRYHLLRFL